MHKNDHLKSQISNRGFELNAPRPAVSKQVALPLSTAMGIAWTSLRVRVARSVLTLITIAMAIAFLTDIVLLRVWTPDAAREPAARTIWLLALSLLVCVVGISNAMLMSVMERFREIGTMKCLGALDSFILRLFFFESLFLGAAGSFVGATIGVGLARPGGAQIGCDIHAASHAKRYPRGIRRCSAGHRDDRRRRGVSFLESRQDGAHRSDASRSLKKNANHGSWITMTTPADPLSSSTTPAQTREEIVRTIDVTKEYTMGEEIMHVLKGITLTIFKGEYISIMGPSGSGKSTLFNAIGGLDKPTAGKVFIDQVDIAQLDALELAWLRSRKIGYIFQTFNLIPVMTAVENVALPMIFAGMSNADAMEKAAGILKRRGTRASPVQ